MRILELILAPMLGGAETLVSGLASEWRRSGHSVDVVTLDPASSAGTRDLAATLFMNQITEPKPLHLPGQIPVPLQVQRVVRLAQYLWHQPDYDVVHTHSLLPNLYGRAVSMFLAPKAKMVETIHSVGLSSEYGSWPIRRVEEVLLQRTDAVVAVSNHAATEFVELFPGSSDRVVTIPNGISLSPHSKQSYPRSPTRFFAASRITRAKNIALMIRAFDRFASSVDDSVSLDIAGPFEDMSYVSELVRTIEETNDPTRFRLLGPRSDISSLLLHSDVFVHTSLRESHGLSVIEAAVAGLPIVASDLPAIRDSLEGASILIDPGNEDEVCQALLEVYRDWPSKVRISREFASEASRRFSIEQCASRYLGIFQFAQD